MFLTEELAASQETKQRSKKKPSAGALFIDARGDVYRSGVPLDFVAPYAREVLSELEFRFFETVTDLQKRFYDLHSLGPYRILGYLDNKIETVQLQVKFLVPPAEELFLGVLRNAAWLLSGDIFVSGEETGENRVVEVSWKLSPEKVADANLLSEWINDEIRSHIDLLLLVAGVHRLD